MSYLEAYDVIAHLSRIFGPMGWDKEVSYALIFETQREGAKTGWDVAYTAQCRLTVRDPEGNVLKVSEDVATGSAANQPIRADAHDLAIKSAVSDALKRAAKDLGNQFGLSLYDGGSTDSVLGSSLVYPPKTKPLADQLHNELPTGVLDGEDLEAARQSGLFDKP
jgi:recombination DNA repair RAD52 pathway protein